MATNSPPPDQPAEPSRAQPLEARDDAVGARDDSVAPAPRHANEGRKPPVRYAPIARGGGITEAERYVQGLCERSFLKLWSYPGVYRDQGVGQRKEGKEVCDLLVVFGDDVLIFSDKDCEFPDSGNLKQDWSRWFRRAVMKSAEQIWGAERWILDHPGRLYLDRACTAPFPIALPSRARARVHRIVVAHAVSRRCRDYHGGTGSLMLIPHLIGEDHFAYPKRPVMPFAVGDLDPSRGYVHVLDDQALDTVLRTLDTISDFVAYLTRKAELIRSGRLAGAAGEDELLAVYLTHFDGTKHHFPVPDGVTHVFYDEGFWTGFETSQQRRAQVEANRVSYRWDALIEEFGRHMLSGTSVFRSHDDVREVEPALRYMAAESRTRRRMLAQALMGTLELPLSASLGHAVRVIASHDPSAPCYVFATLEQKPGESNDEYRAKRRQLLEAYCLAAGHLHPTAAAVVGIATQPGTDRPRSEDVMAMDARDWTADTAEHARMLYEELGLLRQRRESAHSVSEYPELDTRPGSRPAATDGNNSRNKPCACGSGKKYKKCCGRAV